MSGLAKVTDNTASETMMRKSPGCGASGDVSSKYVSAPTDTDLRTGKARPHENHTDAGAGQPTFSTVKISVPLPVDGSWFGVGLTSPPHMRFVMQSGPDLHVSHHDTPRMATGGGVEGTMQLSPPHPSKHAHLPSNVHLRAKMRHVRALCTLVRLRHVVTCMYML